MSPNKKLFKHWYLLSLRGLLIIVLGIFAFTYAGDQTHKLSFIRIFEIFAITSGLLLIQTALTNRKDVNWHWILMAGVLDFLFGILLWMVPLAQGSNVLLVLAIWFLYSGAILFVESFVLIYENVKNWWFEMVSGLLSIIMAFMLIAVKMDSRKELYVTVGILALIQGMFMSITPFVLKKEDV